MPLAIYPLTSTVHAHGIYSTVGSNCSQYIFKAINT